MATFTEKILDYLQLQAEDTLDLITILLSDRRTAIRKARYSLVHGPPTFKTNWAEKYRERQKFYSLLNQLKRDGLVGKKKSGKRSQWRITKKGARHLALLKGKPHHIIFEKRSYVKKNGPLVIISFDIPEQERRKRLWLRTNLVALGFEMLQKSVWIGKIELPQEFMHDLKKYRVLSYVHIFSVNKSGSIAKTP